MADEIRTTDLIGAWAVDEINGRHHQRVKIQHGEDGSATDVSLASPLPVDDVLLAEAAGRVTGRMVVAKFGRNPEVGTSIEDITAIGGTYAGFLTAASAVRIKAGGNSNDTAAGSGARSVFISGLDENWAMATEELATAGASASSATTTTFVRVFRVWVGDVGTYGAANTDDIEIETTGGVTVALIEATYGQSQLAVYTVPVGYQAYIRRLGCSVEGSKKATTMFFQRQNADVVVAPFQGKRLIQAFEYSNQSQIKFESYKGPYPAKTDLWASGYINTGSVAMNATMDILLEAV